MLHTLVYVLASKGLVEQTLGLFQNLPSDQEHKPRIQTAGVLFFLNEENLMAAQQVADTIEVSNWKLMVQALIDSRTNEIDDEIRFNRIVRLIDETMLLAQKVTSPEIKAWLLTRIPEALAVFGKLETMFSIAEAISNVNSRHRFLAEIAVSLARAGMIDHSYASLEEIRDRDIKKQIISRISDVLVEAEPETALNGLQMLLTVARHRGQDLTLHTITEVIPLVESLGQPEQGPDLLWRTQLQLSRFETFWQPTSG